MQDYFSRMFDAVHVELQDGTMATSIYTDLCVDILSTGMMQEYVSPLHVYYSASFQYGGTVAKNMGMYYASLCKYYHACVTLQLAVYKFNYDMNVDWDIVRNTTSSPNYLKSLIGDWTPEPLTNKLMHIVALHYEYEVQHANGEYTFAEAHYIKRKR